MVMKTRTGVKWKSKNDENTFKPAGFLLDLQSCLLNMCIVFGKDNSELL